MFCFFFKPLHQVFVGNHRPQGWKLLTSIFPTVSPHRVGIETCSLWNDGRFMLAPCTSIPEWLTRWRGSIGSQRRLSHCRCGYRGVRSTWGCWDQRPGWVSTAVAASHYGMPFAMKEDCRKIKTNDKLCPRHDANSSCYSLEKVTIRKVVYLKISFPYL